MELLRVSTGCCHLFFWFGMLQVVFCCLGAVFWSMGTVFLLLKPLSSVILASVSVLS